MPKDIMPKVTYCPKTLCPIWQYAQEDILPKDFMPKMTICPKRTLCPRWHFAHIFKGFCLRIFWNTIPMHISYRQFKGGDLLKFLPIKAYLSGLLFQKVVVYSNFLYWWFNQEWRFKCVNTVWKRLKQIVVLGLWIFYLFFSLLWFL